MRLKIAVLAGDGIGPEVTQQATNILRAVAELGGHDFTFVEALIGGTAITQTGSPLPAATLDAALESDAVLLGAVATTSSTPSPRQAPRSRPPPNPSGARRLRQPAPLHRLRRPRRQLPPPPRGHQGRRHSLRPRATRRPLLRQTALVGPRNQRSHQTPCVTPKPRSSA